MVSKVECETIDTRSLELESIISHMTIIFEVRTIYRLRFIYQYISFTKEQPLFLWDNLTGREPDKVHKRGGIAAG